MPRSGASPLEEFLREARKVGGREVGETVGGLARRLGRKTTDILKLDANENLFLWTDIHKGVLQRTVDNEDPRLYPLDAEAQLRETLGAHLKAPPESVVIGAGIGQLIDLVSTAFLRSRNGALSIAPTYPAYERSARARGAAYRGVPLREDFSLDADAILAAATPRTKLIFLCSPNDPTGNRFGDEEVRRLVEGFRGLVVVDEAYVDYAEGSVLGLAGRYDNLVVLRTFSTAFGLAGLRLGYAVADEELASALDRYQTPHSVSLYALRLGVGMLGRAAVERAVGEARTERGRLVGMLNGIEGVRAFPSEANFVLFEAGRGSAAVHRALLDRGVMVRNIGRALGWRNCIRVTVAPRMMMDAFLEALRGVLKGSG